MHIHTRKNDGFTLIEIVIAIAIVGFMMTAAVIGYRTILSWAEKRSVTSSLTTIKEAIEMYKITTGQYPTSLRDLVEKPTDQRLAQKWPGELLESDKLKDPWGEEYHYQLTRGEKHPYKLYSEGNPEDPNRTPIDVWLID